MHAEPGAADQDRRGGAGAGQPAAPPTGDFSIFTPEYVRSLERAFRRIFPAMGVAELLRAALEWQAHPLDAWLNAAFGAVFLAGALGLRLHRSALTVIRGAFLLACAVALSFYVLSYGLLPPGLAAAETGYVLAGHYMYLLYVLMLLCWLLFPPPWASRVALSLYLVSLLLGLLASGLALSEDRATLTGVLNYGLHHALVGGSFYVLLGVFTAVYARQARLERDRARLSRDALTDPLTGLANRRAFDAALEREGQAAHASGRPLSLVTLDLDRFKAVNDTCGHDAGDRVLMNLAALLRRQVRSGDLPARWGGEEFAWLLSGAPAEAAVRTADRLRVAVAAHDFGCGRLTLTVSLGAATLRPGESGADLFARADGALYRAKQSGRDRVELDDAP